ncbi:hypothetical protein GN956_G6076 [Arapaima gigas]
MKGIVQIQSNGWSPRLRYSHGPLEINPGTLGSHLVSTTSQQHHVSSGRVARRCREKNSIEETATGRDSDISVHKEGELLFKIFQHLRQSDIV